MDDESIFKFDGRTLTATVLAIAKVHAAQEELTELLRRTGQITTTEALRWTEEANRTRDDQIGQAYFNARHS